LAAYRTQFAQTIDTEFSGTLTGSVSIAVSHTHPGQLRGTPPRQRGIGENDPEKGVDASGEPQTAGGASQNAANPGRRHPLIRKKIIGHRMRRLGPRFARGGALLRMQGALAQLHQQARQHGVGTFLQVDVKQLSNLLAHVGSVAQPREFITLQTIPRGREKEIPRRLGRTMAVQGALQGTAVRYQYINIGQWY
jgi:hypothetical protein